MRSRLVALLARRTTRGWLGLIVLLGATPALAAAGDSNVIVPGGAVIAGHTYAQWEARSWQWELANVRFYKSPPPSVPRCTTAGQRGPIWFLHGDNYANAGNAITRSCHVPAGRYLFLDQPSIDCSTVEPPPYHATTNAGLLRCARSFGRVTSTLTLDGKKLTPSGFTVATGAFRFTMPPHNNYLGVAGRTKGRAAAYGQAVMLRPLGRGSHTLVRTGHSRGAPSTRSTYHLIIG